MSAKSTVHAVYVERETVIVRGITGIAPTTTPAPGWILQAGKNVQHFLSAEGIELMTVEPEFSNNGEQQ